MPVVNYSVLKGDPVSGRVVPGNHYRIEVSTPAGQIEVDVNIQSVDGSEVLYVIDEAFTPPAPAGLLALPDGLTRLPSKAGGLALDYVRSTVAGKPMVTQAEFTLLPKSIHAGSRRNQLTNAVINLLNMAIADANGTLYAFGSAFADTGGLMGIHDIHMNQGNAKPHTGDNGVWQDGAIFINLPATSTWMAIFVAFQTESWHTNPATGNPV